MRLTLPLAAVALAALTSSVSGVVNFNLDFDATVDSVKAVLTSIKNALEVKSDVIRLLAEQTMKDQVRQEERIRHEGDSGIVLTRSYEEGSENYLSASHAGHSFASSFDKMAMRDTLGFGEIVAVINGVEFRTHSTIYSLVMPHRTSSRFLDTEPIPQSPVPPSVLSKGSVQEQVEEMAEYFRAFKTQNSTHRNYSPYFRPVLCYLEAAWMSDVTGIPENWFPVDRVHLGAQSWPELFDRARTEFLAGTRDKSSRGAYLPSIITHIEPDTGHPVYAQWNFRPMCQPIDGDLPTAYLRQVRDYTVSAERGLSMDEMMYRRGAHFVLDEKKKPGYRNRKLLEELVSQVPGLDNGPAHLNRTLFSNPPEKDWEGQAVLNSGYYSHWYNVGTQDGLSAQPRGFSDRNLFVASTTQPQIAEFPATYCQNRRSCTSYSQRLSYMIPLEIVYTTPLASWNPYNVKDFGADRGGYRAGGKNGRSQARAFHGIQEEFFYQTPAEFFSGPVAVDASALDDRLRELWFLDGQGVPRKMEASGVRTILPDITGGVGQVRTRYPIAPVHWRGSAAWKELSAYQDSLPQ